MKIWFQIYTGNVNALSDADAKSILSAIRPFHEAGKLGGILTGWGWRPDLYEALGKQLGDWNVPFYFKTAAFSEIEEAPAFLKSNLQYDAMVDRTGGLVPPFVLNKQEQFLFRCPSSKANHEIVSEWINYHLSRFPFNGVFFDRIRYSSLISGIHGIGCFCSECRKRYENAGIDVDRLCAALSTAEQTNDLQLMRYHDGIWDMKDQDMTQFFKTRCDIITENVAFWSEELHKKGIKVGLDLFAPVFGYFAGQDVLSLSEKVDFIKPMLYQFTDAPAGLVFEKRAAMKTSGYAFSTVEELFEEELKILKKASCHVYPGIDVNVVEPICHPTKEDIQRTMADLTGKGVEGIVAAWNLMMMPKGHLEALLSD